MSDHPPPPTGPGTPPTQAAKPASMPVAMPPPKPSIARRTAGAAGKNFRALPRWKKALLILAVVLMLAGFAGVVVGYAQPRPPERQAAMQTVESLQLEQRRANLTPENQARLDSALEQVRDLRHWFYDQTAPNLWRWGLAFFAGFVLGFAFRMFIKTMAILAAIVLVAGGVAAYLGYIDISNVGSQISSATGWLMDRAATIKETAIAFLGASLVGTAGLVIGFMRK